MHMYACEKLLLKSPSADEVKVLQWVQLITWKSNTHLAQYMECGVGKGLIPKGASVVLLFPVVTVVAHPLRLLP